MTPAGIEPATFRFVAQHLNHCATAVPISACRWFYYKKIHVVPSSSELFSPRKVDAFITAIILPCFNSNRRISAKCCEPLEANPYRTNVENRVSS